MAKHPQKIPSGAQAKAGGVSAVVALNRIVYGDRQVAVAGSLFFPTSQEQYDELLALQAVRAPTDAEQALAAKLPAATAGLKPSGDPDAAPAAMAPEDSLLG